MAERGEGGAAERIAAIDRLLDGLREGFQADGYDLKVDAAGADHAAVSVLAGPEACEECLVPKPIVEGMLLKALGPGGIRSVSLRYPEDAAG